ncbi:C-type lectin domain family 17, member A-like isoform X6 [Oncorhynchus keta]|uniref:C-type lectin domain family 17, member A-like isoform X6 n=1 Tax=Oncorhynchus keta TaxID=8018 RepID=UPI00227B23E3|nr:C-type lectin domain family 17, member A-like isoform X6 [Oncorhynchus keta]
MCDSVHVQWWKRPSGVAAVCLGLLCVLLLAGTIGLSVYYQLQTSYNTLTEERDQLQDSNSLLTKERDQLKTSYNNLIKVIEEQTCPEGWQKLKSSWYFLSTETKTWKESRPGDSMERERERERERDLIMHILYIHIFTVYIYLSQRQTFLFNLKKRVWIGLTDSVIEGTWKWVDGTPLTTR